MNERLPVNIENNELPLDDMVKKVDRKNNYGYVSIMYLLSLLITLGSVITIIVLGG